jgi:hypothetical protein
LKIQYQVVINLISYPKSQEPASKLKITDLITKSKLNTELTGINPKNQNLGQFYSAIKNNNNLQFDIVSNNEALALEIFIQIFGYGINMLFFQNFQQFQNLIN